MRKFNARWWVNEEWSAAKWEAFLEAWPWKGEEGISIRYIRNAGPDDVRTHIQMTIFYRSLAELRAMNGGQTPLQ